MNIKFDEYNSLTYSEKLCFGKLESLDFRLLTMTLEDVSNYCQVSTATINRTLKKMGYQNLKQFKQSIDIKPNPNLSEYDNRVIDIISNDIPDIRVYFENCDEIFIVGFGTTSSLANDLVLQLRNLGIKSEALTDSEMLNYVSFKSQTKQLIVYFSYTGSDLDMQKLAVENKHKISQILITCTTNSILSHSCDIQICSNTADIDGFLNSRTPLYIYQSKLIQQLKNNIG